MITPRQTRLVRVPDLKAFHHAIARHACAGNAADIRSSAVIVPTEAAGHQLRTTLENIELLGPASGGRRVAIWPAILTRDGWYDCLHHASPRAPRQLGAIEREVLMARAAREAVAAGHRPPFHVRPPLVAEMLRFLDTMLRLGRTLDAFERLTVDELEARAPIDRGAERLLRQTRFLVASFRRYGDLVAASDAHDEHLLRAHLLAQDATPPFRRVVVTVGDRSCGPDGLWPADFDLLARLPRLDRIEVIATTNVLAAGFHERLHDLLPGLEEIDFGQPAAVAGCEPLLVRPAGAETAWWVSRDREEEIAAIARRIKARFLTSEARSPQSDVNAGSNALETRHGSEGAASIGLLTADGALSNPVEDVGHRTSDVGRPSASEPDLGPRTSDIGRTASPPALDRVAIVCKRPLPYLYLAWSCLGAAGIPVQAFDDLPLAAEPFAAALDVVFRFVESGFARRHAVALLRSPHFSFSDAAGVISREATDALDAALRETSGDADPATLDHLIARCGGPEASSAERLAARAAAAAAQAARHLEPLRGRQAASARFDLLLGFLESRLASDDGSLLGERTARARVAVLGALRDLATAHRRYDDPLIDFDQFVSTIRRWMEAQTFSPRTGRGGVHLVDADAARYGDFREVHLVGLVEREWPDKEGRTIFYPLSLLNQLGWPPERLRLASARAAFRDLVGLAGARVSVSTFVLEDDGLVEPSPFLDEIERTGLPATEEAPAGNLRIVPDEALSLEPVRTDVLDADTREWAALRQARSAAEESKYHGMADPVAVRSLAVRRIEMYVDCPFRYFAEVLLALRDESDEDPAEGPRAQGKFLHDVLAAFFDSWQAAGHGAITAHNIDTAREVFRHVVEAKLDAVPAADAALWRTRLLGSAARTGVGEIVLRAEAVAADDVVERLLEYPLEGPCRLRYAENGEQERPSASSAAGGVQPAARTAESRERVVNLRGVADRIDVLAGKRFRIVDYKLGRAPDVRRAVQLPLYAVQAEGQFASRGQHDMVAAGAAYLAFGERDPYVPLAGRSGSVEEAITDGQNRALQAIDGIEHGWFPAQPAQPFRCSHCPYASLCRKDYVDEQQ